MIITYTTAITDSAVSLSNNIPADSHVMYIAHYAPHLPLQAPQDKIDACRERYKAGYDVLRQQRFERQKALGLITPEMVLPVFQKDFRTVNDPPGPNLLHSSKKMDNRYGYLCRHDRNHGQRHRKGNTDLKKTKECMNIPCFCL